MFLPRRPVVSIAFILVVLQNDYLVSYPRLHREGECSDSAFCLDGQERLVCFTSMFQAKIFVHTYTAGKKRKGRSELPELMWCLRKLEERKCRKTRRERERWKEGIWAGGWRETTTSRVEDGREEMGSWTETWGKNELHVHEFHERSNGDAKHILSISRRLFRSSWPKHISSSNRTSCPFSWAKTSSTSLTHRACIGPSNGPSWSHRSRVRQLLHWLVMLLIDLSELSQWIKSDNKCSESEWIVTEDYNNIYILTTTVHIAGYGITDRIHVNVSIVLTLTGMWCWWRQILNPLWKALISKCFANVM